jgi:hypothetical protein
MRSQQKAWPEGERRWARRVRSGPLWAVGPSRNAFPRVPFRPSPVTRSHFRRQMGADRRRTTSPDLGYVFRRSAPFCRRGGGGRVKDGRGRPLLFEPRACERFASGWPGVLKRRPLREFARRAGMTGKIRRKVQVGLLLTTGTADKGFQRGPRNTLAQVRAWAGWHDVWSSCVGGLGGVKAQPLHCHVVVVRNNAERFYCAW